VSDSAACSSSTTARPRSHVDRLVAQDGRLITLLEEFQTLGIAFVSLGEGIDATTPAGKLQTHSQSSLSDTDLAAALNLGRPLI
jgi:hypothetical protein